MAISRVSLLWKILLSTSIAITVLLLVTVLVVQDHAVRTTSLSLESEVGASFHAYESLWRARAEMLSSLSLVISRMSDVRAAFGTGDRATIRDTAEELWSRIAREGAIFLVTDPSGVVLTSLGDVPGKEMTTELPAVRAAASSFPKQAKGFLVAGRRLYQIVITPVYVEAGGGLALLNVLVAGYEVNRAAAEQLKQATGNSDLLFLAGSRVIASTLAPGPTRLILAAPPASGPQHVDSGEMDYVLLSNPLLDVLGHPIGELRIVRSFEGARQRIAVLRQDIFLTWLASVLTGLGLTFVLARRILEPVKELDLAAAEIARGNYEYRVGIRSQDELGRLAKTFNGMCESIQNAREELVRQERLNTIGRLSSSIVHDLRNPLAAIYGGAEMLVDGELSKEQTQRLASNMYRSSRTIQQLLQELVDVSRGKSQQMELCNLRDVVMAAYDVCAPAATTQAVSVEIQVSDTIDLPLERPRMERVFMNLINNALEAMPEGGHLDVAAKGGAGGVVVEVLDTGPGIPSEIRSKLFNPFVTGKKNGLGLGLALSRQTVRDHGGDLWIDPNTTRGTRMILRLPTLNEVPH